MIICAEIEWGKTRDTSSNRDQGTQEPRTELLMLGQVYRGFGDTSSNVCIILSCEEILTTSVFTSFFQTKCPNVLSTGEFGVDASFHTAEWHAARIAALTTERMSWEDWKKKQKDEAMAAEAQVGHRLWRDAKC